MELATLGRLVFGAGLLALGVQNLIVGDFFPELQPVPGWVPAALAYATGATLAGAAIFVMAGRHVRTAARVLVVVLGLCVVALHAPRLAADLRNGGAWTGALEILAFTAAAWLLAEAPLAIAARIVFGCAFIGFGFLHFRHADYVAYVVPA